jgi:hypothetical protein
MDADGRFRGKNQEWQELTPMTQKGEREAVSILAGGNFAAQLVEEIEDEADSVLGRGS